MLQIQHMNKILDDKHILSDINLKLQKCKLALVVGENGSGKTTLLKCVSTLLLPESGTVKLDNIEYCSRNFNTIRKKISVLFEGSRSLYWDMTLIQNIKYFCGLYNLKFSKVKDEIYNLINAFEIKKYKHTLVAKLSKGTQQKASLIIALLKPSELLILDEPETGLDFKSINILIEILISTKKSKSIIITTQYPQLFESISDKIIKVTDGLVKETILAQDGVKKAFAQTD